MNLKLNFFSSSFFFSFKSNIRLDALIPIQAISTSSTHRKASQPKGGNTDGPTVLGKGKKHRK